MLSTNDEINKLKELEKKKDKVKTTTKKSSNSKNTKSKTTTKKSSNKDTKSKTVKTLSPERISELNENLTEPSALSGTTNSALILSICFSLLAIVI